MVSSLALSEWFLENFYYNFIYYFITTLRKCNVGVFF